MAQLSPRLQSRLAKVPDIARAAAAKAMEEGAELIVQEMKKAAPVLKDTANKSRRPGALRDSIGWTWGEIPAGSFTIADIRSGKNAGEQYATLQIKIYAGNREAFYGRWQEFGTKEHPAHPFFFSVWKKHRAGFRRRIRNAVRKTIREAYANG